MPDETKPTKTESENDTLVRLNAFFVSSLDHPTWISWRENAVKCYAYKEGEQWSAEELSALKKRGQPATVNNQIKVTIDRMVGQFVKQRTRLGFRGRNPQDEKIANALTDVFLFIRQNNNFEYEERETAEDGFTSGFGIIEAWVSFDDLLNPEIKLASRDPLDFYPDPNFKRYNWNEDAKFIARAKWMDLDEATALYPKHKLELNGVVNESPAVLSEPTIDGFKNDIYVDTEKKRVRLVETWYKTRERKVLFTSSSGQTTDVSHLPDGKIKKRERKDPGSRVIEKVESKMWMAVHTAGIVFSHKEVDRKHFPFVPFIANRKKTGEPYSQILLALPLQDAINKRESKAIHLLNTNQTISEENIIKDKVQHAIEKARPDGHMEVAPGGLSQNKFELRNNVELAATQFTMHSEAKVDLRQVTGVNPDALGEPSAMRSGVGVARKQQMTDIIVAPIFDNFRRTLEILGQVVLELVQKFLTEKKVFMITDDLNKSREITINSDESNDLKVGIFDVISEDLPDTTTIQQEQMQTIGSLLPQILPFGPFWTKLLLQMSDIRNKDEMIKQIEAQSQPPPPDAKISLSLQWTEMTAIEKIAWAMKLQMPELAQALQQAQPEAAHIVKAKVDLETDQNNANDDIIKGQFDMAKGQQDLESNREKNQQAVGLALLKGQIDIKKARASKNGGSE